ncbi:GxxExxY protein [Aerophototrophica crusticola]|uniref:GxxExxY protein n=1 Tax=Aerophototrophica crusticola TaxID=1709002 RepID=A0A858R797_9PROT|nr:GxxExxY protein [Rhodospirillaceae bacterium B3]
MKTDRVSLDPETQDLTATIIGGAMKVSNALGHGFLEAVYRKAMLVELGRRGLSATAHVPFKVRYEGTVVGDYVADLVVEKRVIVELKAVSTLLPEHKAQVINYLRASGLHIGLLFNFGSSELEYKRLIY